MAGARSMLWGVDQPVIARAALALDRDALALPAEAGQTCAQHG